MPQTTTEQVAAEIRAVLGRQGKPQLTLAPVLGISQQAISKRLRGRIPFDVDELAAIAAHLDVPLSSLLPAEREPVAS